jgi:hypothetical protein
VAISYSLARAKVGFLGHESRAACGLEISELEDVVDRAAVLVESSGLALAGPEIVAAQGALAYLNGALDAAQRKYGEALELCSSAGNSLSVTSSRSMIGWLAQRLALPSNPPPPPARRDLLGLIGAPLTRDWMLERLESLFASED